MNRYIPLPFIQRMLFFLPVLLLGCDGTPIQQETNSGSIPLERSLERSIKWPPRMNQVFPDVTFLDDKGQSVSMTSFKGYVLLLEFVHMGDLSQAEYVNAQDNDSENEKEKHKSSSPGYQDIPPRSLFPEYAGLQAKEHRVKHVQILIYGPDNEKTQARHVELWQKDKDYLNRLAPVVVVPSVDLRNDATDQLLGGYMLLDKDNILRFNAAGPRPADDLKTKLLPALADYSARLSEPTGRFSLEWSGSDNQEQDPKKTEDFFKKVKPLKN